MTTTLERLRSAENFREWTFERTTKLPPSDRERNGRRLRYPMGSGPWDDEPDKVQWIDPTTGFDCLILRNHFGAWCGYVGVDESHPWHGIDYGTCAKGGCEKKAEDWYCDHEPQSMLSVHGGITFADSCAATEDPEAICHVAAPGRADHVWWFGFDCAHSGDLAPGMRRFEERTMPHILAKYPELEGLDVYRDLEYVVRQVESLAVQLSAVA